MRSYDFRGLGGVYYEFATNTLYVVDAVNDDITPRRYLVREFDIDGTFKGAFHLNPAGRPDPDHVDTMAFDRRGIPFYNWRDEYDFQKTTSDNTTTFWGIYQLLTATVRQPTELPFDPVIHGGVAALAADGDTFSLGYLSLDPDKAKTDNRKIAYLRAEESKSPLAIFGVPDPFNPTTGMAMAPAGVLYFCGPTPQATFAIDRLDSNQQLRTFVTLDHLPSGMWADPKGNLYVGYDQTSGPAIMRKYTPDGTLLGETGVRVANGYLVHVAGVTFDPQGRVIVAGNGIDTNNQQIQGLYTFAE